MEKVYEKQYHQSEDDHWWFVSRRALVSSHICRYQLVKSSDKILDIGCSAGRLLLDLISKGFSPDKVFGIDVSQEAIDLCLRSGLKNCKVMDGMKPEWPENSFDIIVASDSLEHISNDSKALQSWYKILKPGGLLFVYVPAFQFLWSEHDEVNHHFRRYTKNGLTSILEKTEFNIIESGYWNSTLFPLFALIRMTKNLIPAKRNSPQSDLKTSSPIVDSILKNLLSLENSLIGMGVRFPFGLSTYAISKKSIVDTD